MIKSLVYLEIGLVIAWSSGFVGARFASESAPVFLVLLWRFTIVAIGLSPLAIATAYRHGIGKIGLHLLIGALAMFGFIAAAVKAVDLGVPAGIVALICALQPMATASLSGVVLGERVRPKQWSGLLVGFVGVAIAVAGDLGSAPLWAYSLPVIAVASLVAGTLIVKAKRDDTPLLPSLAIQSTAAAVLFIPLALSEGHLAPSLNPGFIASVAWFIVFSTIGAYGFYWLCLRHGSATRVASLIYLTPPVTAIWAWLMFGDPIAPQAVLGFALCLFGAGLARGTATGLHRSTSE